MLPTRRIFLKQLGLGAGALENVGDLAEMEARVDRHRDQSSPPCREQYFDIFGRVRHHDANPVADLQPEL